VHDRDGRRIGEVTSACHSPRLQRNIGYAMVPIEHAGIGTPLVVHTQHGPQDAVVVAKPFVDPGKDIPKRLDPRPAVA
jgi:glycine cleavage system aminomethyltransferase T